MPNPRMQPITLYVVVCSELHRAFGPFALLENATKAAREFTDQDSAGCVYVPVPLAAQGEITMGNEPTDLVSKMKDRGYL